MGTEYQTKKVFEPGNGYTKQDWDAVDSPEITDAELARMKPAKDVLPSSFFEGLAEARRGRGRPKLEKALVPVTLRVEPDVLNAFKASGADWRVRMNEALRKAAGL
ncbi:BrnA antitoxin family protein [Rhizobium herbae]